MSCSRTAGYRFRIPNCNRAALGEYATEMRNAVHKAETWGNVVATRFPVELEMPLTDQTNQHEYPDDVVAA